MPGSFISKYKRTFLIGSAGAVVGAMAGFFYWKFVGCDSQTCAIWSNPFRSTIYGAALGTLLLLIIVPDSPKNKNPNT